MTSIKDGTAAQRYRSGDAARLAKMPVTTLRIWERRYGVIAPSKSASGQRLYSAEDVQRLVLLKTLVKRGHSIGSIARLDQAQLEQLALSRSERETSPSAADSSQSPDFTLGLVGAALARRLVAEGLHLPDFGVREVSEFVDLDQATLSLPPPPVDALLLSLPALHDDIAAQILALGEACQAKVISVGYAFGTGRATELLRLAGVRLYREPGGRIALRQVLNDLYRAMQGYEVAGPEVMRSRAARRFSDQELEQMASSSSTIACECPRHLTELVMQLSSFEKYSDDCGSRTLEDALLHRHLGDVANRALAMFESALAHIAREEGWTGPGGAN